MVIIGEGTSYVIVRRLDRHTQENIIEAVEEGEIPQPWLDVAYPTMADLEGFLADLKERTDFLRDWQVNGPPRLVSFCKGWWWLKMLMLD